MFVFHSCIGVNGLVWPAWRGFPCGARVFLGSVLSTMRRKLSTTNLTPVNDPSYAPAAPHPFSLFHPKSWWQPHKTSLGESRNLPTYAKCWIIRYEYDNQYLKNSQAWNPVLDSVYYTGSIIKQCFFKQPFTFYCCVCINMWTILTKATTSFSWSCGLYNIKLEKWIVCSEWIRKLVFCNN